MARRFVSATDLLASLGITEPEEIDVYAIAQSQGATVVEKRVTGCEARIVGYGERALIVVNSESIPARKRFSAAHELGHWMRDAGKVSLGCNPEAIIGSGGAETERKANRYASDLLMPKFMFKPRAERQPVTLETASYLGDLFQTSLTATSIRLVDYSSFPAMLVCSDVQRVRWFRRNDAVPRSLWPETPGRLTFAGKLLRGTTGRGSGSGDIRSEHWFSSALRHRVHEDSRLIRDGLALTLLWWTDEGALTEIHEEQERLEYRRSDGRDWD